MIKARGEVGIVNLAIVVLFGGAAAVTAAPSVTLTQSSANVGRYDVYEVTMTDPATYANPWEDLT